MSSFVLMQTDSSENSALTDFGAELNGRSVSGSRSSEKTAGRSASRLRVVWTARKVSSQAMNLRPCFEATKGVVPDPQKKSAIRSPEFEDASNIRSSSATGFCVG